MSEISLRANLSALISEYQSKIDAVEENIRLFEEAGSKLRSASCIQGKFGNTTLDTGRVTSHAMKASLLYSAWSKAYDLLQIERIATAKDKKLFEQEMANPPEFNMDNVRATFGDYIRNPWESILRGLAEVFCSLDQSYKSHEKVKIGVKGLPKRVVISNVNSIYGYGHDKIRDILNALAAYQGKELIDHQELRAFIKDGNLYRDRKVYKKHISAGKEEETLPVDRGVWLKIFKNGNGHLFFDEIALADINKALYQYYGDVLADCYEARPDRRSESTDVSKDLQYYPTPIDVVDTVINNMYRIEQGEKILEPSCGCGRFMDALRDKGANVFGIEADPQRAEQCRQKGHRVLTANFLETEPTGDYDRVVMNPPFYGKHYAKHINHALKFLKPDGILVSILPATARYDHGIVKGRWSDLPFGSFRESGTNINTTVLTIKL